MWGIDGGHGKTYASFAVYRGLSEGGFVTLDKTSADASVTAGNGEYTLAGAVYGVYQGGSLVAQFTTDESGHGQTSEKLPFPLFFIIKLLILNLLFTKLLATLTAC